MFHVKHLLLFKGFNPSKNKAPATENYPLYAGEGKQTFCTKNTFPVHESISMTKCSNDRASGAQGYVQHYSGTEPNVIFRVSMFHMKQ